MPTSRCVHRRSTDMIGAKSEYFWEDLYPSGVCQLSDLIKSALDQEIVCLPKRPVSDEETRYPINEASMRAFLETFFTRHLFQVQRSLAEYIASIDFRKAAQSGLLRILDIGAGPAVASLGIIDMIHRTAGHEGLRTGVRPRGMRLLHVLNDTSHVCLTTGKHMLAACHGLGRHFGLALSDDRVLTLSTAFPSNMRQIQRLASFLGGYDIIILSYVVTPLTDDYGLQSLAAAMRAFERLCRPCGRILVVQDQFQKSLIQSLSHLLHAEYREHTVTQEIYLRCSPKTMPVEMREYPITGVWFWIERVLS